MAGDTCVAMNEYVQNPTTHTALDNIIPCVDNATAQETLIRSREVASQLVDVVNTVITNVSNINFAPSFVPMYFNQSGPLVPPLCNPFHHDLTDRPCSAGEVDMNNATQVNLLKHSPETLKLVYGLLFVIWVVMLIILCFCFIFRHTLKSNAHHPNV